MNANKPIVDLGHARSTLTTTIEGHLQSLRDLQADLMSLFDRKTAAIVSNDIGALQRFTVEEERIASDLAQTERQRQAILTAAAHVGIRADSLLSLAQQLSLPDSLVDSVQSARGTAEQLQRKCWTQLIVGTRSAQHYRELIDIIAGNDTAGQTYSPQSDSDHGASGGNLLDAAA